MPNNYPANGVQEMRSPAEAEEPSCSWGMVRNPPAGNHTTTEFSGVLNVMKYTGKAHCVGDHIDTDAIIPARFLVTTDPAELGSHCMEGLEAEWVKRVHKGDIMVAGRNFGCGSSREHAPIAILGAGIPVVLAKNFARIFYRNAFNMGLLPVEIGDDFIVHEGDELCVDTDAGTVTNVSTRQSVKLPPMPPTMQAILNAGGLASYVKARLRA